MRSCGRPSSTGRTRCTPHQASSTPNDPPMMANTCYSFVDDKSAVHVASVHHWDEGKKTMVTVAGSGGVSGQDRAQWSTEGVYAWGWAQTVWSDMLT